MEIMPISASPAMGVASILKRRDRVEPLKISCKSRCVDGLMSLG